MCRGLIGHRIGTKAEVVELRELQRGISFISNRDGLAAASRTLDLEQRRFSRFGDSVEIAQLAPAFQAGAIDVNDQTDAAVHRNGQRLSAAHAADSGRQHHPAGKGPAEVAPPQLRERLVGALNDSLRADVDPRTRRHLAVHREPLCFEFAKDAPIRPLRDQIGVGDQHARRASVRFKNGNGLAALHDQRLVVLQPAQRANDRIEGLPRPCGAAVTAIDDQILGTFGNLGIEIVHQHAQCGFLRPTQASEFRTARRPNRARARDCAHISRGILAAADKTSCTT